MVLMMVMMMRGSGRVSCIITLCHILCMSCGHMKWSDMGPHESWSLAIKYDIDIDIFGLWIMNYLWFMIHNMAWFWQTHWGTWCDTNCAGSRCVWLPWPNVMYVSIDRVVLNPVFHGAGGGGAGQRKKTTDFDPQALWQTGPKQLLCLSTWCSVHEFISLRILKSLSAIDLSNFWSMVYRTNLWLN